MSESMHYAPRVTFQEPNQKVRGSLPDLRPSCTCGGSCSYALQSYRANRLCDGDSGGSTESLIDGADTYLRKSSTAALSHQTDNKIKSSASHYSENDLKKDFTPLRQSLPFLPLSPKCLKPGHLAKVIAKNGRVLVGRVRYIGPLVPLSSSRREPLNELGPDTFVGLQLSSRTGDCSGSFEGRKLFDCEPHHGIFVPFKKIVMAWTS